jgi:hypothetical protein
MKKCKHCKKFFEKNKKLSNKQYEKQKYCSRQCLADDIKFSADDSKKSFFQRVVKKEDGCHEWTGAKCEKGYGMFSVAGKKMRAHRAAWFFEHNQYVPDNLLACHKCDNPSCVNPDHLFLGTNKQNSDDKFSKGREFYHRGEKAASSKLKEKDVIFILTKNFSTRDLSKKFGVCESTIRAIKRRENWKHISV